MCSIPAIQSQGGFYMKEQRYAMPNHPNTSSNTLYPTVHIVPSLSIITVNTHHSSIFLSSPKHHSKSSACRPSNHAAISSNNRILNIITTSPIVTITNNANPNQPNIIAVAPTPLFTLPFPKSCAICAAATEAVCCHSTDTYSC